MTEGSTKRAHLSLFQLEGATPAAVNGVCHTYTSGVSENSGRVLSRPLIVPIFWGHAYQTDATIVSAGTQLLSDLATRGYLSNLVQYGVGRASVGTAIIIDTNQQHPAPATLNENQARDRLVAWLRAGTVTPVPSVNEQRRLYFIFPPTTTSLTLSDGTTGFCGYHQHTQYNSSSDNEDLFWGIVGTTGAAGLSGTTFMNSISYCVSHEVGEACSDRDGQGYIADNGCEIGDICETKGTYTYNGQWTVEQYWSNWDSACIQGERPVSLRRWAAAIGFDLRRNGLRALGTPLLGLDYMASRLRG